VGTWRRGLSIALRQIHRASRADERGALRVLWRL